jgi:uncharacterized protein YdiU (UPF0061 family)
MKILTRCFVAFLAVSMMIATTVRSVSAQGMPQQGAPQMPPALQKDYEELQKIGMEFQKTLTPDQQTKMQAMQNKYGKLSADIVAPYRKKLGDNPKKEDAAKAMKEMQPKMEKLQAAAEKEIKVILKPNQMALFNKLQAKQKALMAKAQSLAPKK